MIRALILATSLVLAAGPLLAQNKKVYRCDNGAGRVTYSDEACRGGTELKSDDARSDEQRKAAEDATRREGKLADKLTSERRASEKSTGGPAVGLVPHLAAERAAKDQPSEKKSAPGKKKKKTKNEPGKAAQTPQG
jgi:hypothetical protein